MPALPVALEPSRHVSFPAGYRMRTLHVHPDQNGSPGFRQILVQ